MTPSDILTVGLATVYIYGGLAKLRCVRLLAGTLMTLGAPRHAARLLARLLPVAEIGGGILTIILDVWARTATVMALSTILIGGMFLAWLHSGEEVPCACLGPNDATTLGQETWVRNSALLMASVAVAFNSGGSVLRGALTSADSLSGALLTAALTVAALHAVVARSRDRAMLERIPGSLHMLQRIVAQHATGTERLPRPVTNLFVHDRDGRLTSLRELSEVRPQVLIITSPGCAGCEAVLPLIPTWQLGLDGVADVRALSIRPLCEHRDPDHLPPCSVFATSSLDAEMWTSGILARGTPATCVIREGMVLTHDALSELADIESLKQSLLR